MEEAYIPKKFKLLPSQEEFILKEADKLNSEVEKLLEETRSREKYSLTIIAVVAAWVFTHSNGSNLWLFKAVSFIPTVTTLIYGFSVLFLYKSIKWIGIYLRRIEDYFLENASNGRGNFWGWEKYFDTENKKGKFVSITLLNWIIQLFLAISVFILVFQK